MAAAQIPMVLRKDDALVLAVYDETAATLTELPGEANRYAGDYRECEVVFNPARPTCFAHATTTTLTYTEVRENTSAPADDVQRFRMHTLFAIPMPHIAVSLAFSPKGTYLVSYAMMDQRRTPGGNLSVFDTTTGALVRRGMQARWPAMIWTADEAYVVRPVQGWLHAMPGNLASSTALTETASEGDGGADAEEAKGGSDDDGDGGAAAGHGPLSKLDLMLAQDKEIEYATAPAEGRPMLALFKPFYKQRQATFCVYRLPNLRDGPLYQLNFGRAETASLAWSPSGNYVALLVKSERDPSGKSYYGTVKLHIIDVMSRSITDVKLKGEGETVHDCQWSPTSDELLVVHGKMPRNKCTLFSKSGVAQMTFGEAPRNMAAWAPNGASFIVGGSGNLAGDFQFYTRPQMTPAGGGGGGAGAAAANAVVPVASSAACTGEFNEKCSFQTWAPDSYNFLCSTVFTRLRMDNKIVITKLNGTRVLTQKYPVLYGAHWVAMLAPSKYPPRVASPRAAGEEKPKPQAYRPPGGVSRAAALLRRDPEAAQQAKPAGPVGATVAVQKKKRRH